MGDTTKIVIGLVMIAVALIVFPIVLTGVDTILAWTGTGAATIADFTGLETLVSIAPLLIFIGLLVGGGILTFSGFKAVRAGGGGRSRSRR